MAIPSPSNFPGALDTTAEQPSPLAATELDATNFLHDKVHTNHSSALIALETKMGISSSRPTAVGDTLVCTALGAGAAGDTTVWQQPAESDPIPLILALS
jgi:hypothetical protein